LNRGSKRLLLVDADPARGMELYAALRDLRAEVELARDADEGWRRFAAMRPGTVILALGPPGHGAEPFLRRLQSEYMGAMPAVFLLCAPGELAAAARLEPDACLVVPVAQAALAALVDQSGDTSGPDPMALARLRELYDLTLLGVDLVRGLDEVARRSALAFQVTDCAAWAWGEDRTRWPRTARPIADAARPALLEKLRAASSARGAVLVARAGASPSEARRAVTDAPVDSLLAFPLVAGDLTLGGISLATEGARIYTQAERDMLALLARRLATEMAWVSAHGRLLVEHERLREAALLDPLTGVWNRAALEQAIASQIQAARRTPQPLTLMVLDVMGLTAINVRHGHLVGDTVLAHLAGLVAANLRAHDAVGRLAGDQFGVLLVGCDAGGARAAADHLRAAVAAHPCRTGDQTVPFGVRFGVSQIRPGEDAGAAALARAEAALRRSRRRSTDLIDAPRDTTDPFGSRRLTGERDAIPAGVTLGGMYRVLHEISRGAMGVVYRGEDLGLGRPIALKVLRPDLASDQELVTRFRAEAAMLASLHHPNLVQVHAFGSEGELVYFVMELVEGEAVADGLLRAEMHGQPLELGQVAKVVDEVSSALDAIHAVGIVHRDVKPDNILLDRVHDRAVLVDVGVAKRQGGQREAAGTPGYAAPESFMDRDPTPASDVYGLAATAYAMLTGLPPFGAGDLLPVFERQLGERPAPPSTLRAGLAPAVDEVLLRALAAEPEARHQSASAFAFALLRSLEQSADAAAEADWLELSGMAPVPDLFGGDEDGGNTQRYRAILDPTGVSPDADSTVTLQPAHWGGSANGMGRGPLECRNVFFRAAYPVLGRQRGTAWLVDLASELPELGQLVRLTVAPRGWHPIHLLGELVRRAHPGEAARREAGHELGHSAFAVGFEALDAEERPGDPAALLAAADALWTRFFRGAQLVVERSEPGELDVLIDPGSGSRLSCAIIEGWLARLGELVGGAPATTRHTEHSPDDGGPCRFQVRWAALAIG
jgi:diguanylate cyclase (GGDEF)-like protein